MKKKFISIQDAKFADWKEWLARYGLELLIFSAVFLIAIFASRPSDIPGDSFMKCYFKLWTGLQCPSCGLTRGFIALFHANFAEAFQLNALTYVLAAFFTYRLIRSASATIFRKYLEVYMPLAAVLGIFALCIIYAVGRLALEIGVKYRWF